MASEIVNKTSDYIITIFKDKLPEIYVYHNFNHTADVVKAVKEIAKKENVNDNDREVLILAAYFHDSGYIKQYDGHEKHSAEIAEEFLTTNGYKIDNIEKVKKCIIATTFPTEPHNYLEEILCDADMAHIGKKDYLDRTELLRVEWENTLNKKLTDEEWQKAQLDFMTRHKFYTKYAKREWDSQKVLHMIKLQKRYKKGIEKREDMEKRSEKMDIEREKIKQKKELSVKASRGIETMFRNTVRTHVEFSAMADNKANIMISINTILIGIIFTGIVKEIYDYSFIKYPVFLLLFVNIVTIILSILVTRPKITQGTFTRDDIHKKRTNLLFFGNFYNMPMNEFQWGMNEMMNDRDYLYNSMIKDFYFLGQVLGKKYKYLSICYNFFLYGIIASVIVFVYVILYYRNVPV